MRVKSRAYVAALAVAAIPALGAGGEPRSPASAQDLGAATAARTDRAASAPDSAAPAHVDLSELSWLAGAWAGEQRGVEMEEHWIPARGGMMLGLHRDVKDKRTVLFEYLRIEAGPEGIVYFASPHGKPGIPFKLVSLEGRKAVFENPDHDFPQRILYWLNEDGSMTARIEGRRRGEPAGHEWRYRRAPDR